MLEADYAKRLPPVITYPKPGIHEAVAKTISLLGCATLEQIAAANRLNANDVAAIMTQLQAQFDIRGNTHDGYELGSGEQRSALARYAGNFRTQRLSQPMYSSRSR